MKKDKLKDRVLKDPKLYARMKAHLYSKRSVLGEDSPFSELLQTMVNEILGPKSQNRLFVQVQANSFA